MQEESPQHFHDIFLSRGQIYVCQVAENEVMKPLPNIHLYDIPGLGLLWRSLMMPQVQKGRIPGTMRAIPSQHKEYPETTTHSHCPQHQKETGFLSCLYKMQTKTS